MLKRLYCDCCGLEVGWVDESKVCKVAMVRCGNCALEGMEKDSSNSFTNHTRERVKSAKFLHTPAIKR